MAIIRVTVGNNVSRNTVTVSDSTTLRTVLEQQEIDYTRGSMTLDGSTLRPGDLDKSFKDFGISEKCWLLAVVKADNAAAINVTGNAVVITSTLNRSDVELVEKYRPAECYLKGGEDGKEIIFVIATTDDPNGSINKNGAEFGIANQDGKATITFPLPAGTEDIKERVAEYIGSAILDLNKIEAKIPEVIDQIRAEKASVLENISVQ